MFGCRVKTNNNKYLSVLRVNADEIHARSADYVARLVKECRAGL
jgi:hypothetical protein